MNPFRVVPIGVVEPRMLDAAADALSREFGAPSTIALVEIDPSFAFHPERRQFHSTMLLEHLARDADGARVLGVIGSDLFIPILTFVFGEAQLDGKCAVVSYYRLSQDFYGLPADPLILEDRLAKEAVHEVGHTFGLTHCDDYECVMAASHSVEWLDIKARGLCESCSAKVSTTESLRAR